MTRHGLSTSRASRWPRLSGCVALAVAVVVLRPADLLACDFYVAYHRLGAGTPRLSIGAGAHVFPGSEHATTGFAPSVDFGARLGSRIMVRPTVGYCSYADQQQLMVGSGLALRIASEGPASVGVQTHAAFVDYGLERSLTLPVVLTVDWTVGALASVFGGAGVRFMRSSFSIGRGATMTSTDSRPTGMIGIDLPARPFQVSGSAVVSKGEEVACVIGSGGCGGGPEAEWSFTTAVRLPLGEGQ